MYIQKHNQRINLADMIFLERWEMNLAGKDILQFPIPDNDILAIIENLKLKPFVKAQSLVAML